MLVLWVTPVDTSYGCSMALDFIRMSQDCMLCTLHKDPLADRQNQPSGERKGWEDKEKQRKLTETLSFDTQA